MMHPKGMHLVSREWLAFGRRHHACFLCGDDFVIVERAIRVHVHRGERFDGDLGVNGLNLINGQNEGSNLVLTGPPGTGKSHMLVAMMNIAASNGLIACYVSMPHLVRTLHLCVQGETGYSVAGALELLKQADVLLIDEIGRHKATEFNKSFIWDLVDAMHRAQKPIVAATNSSAAELRQLFDPAAMNRLIDRGSQLLVCDWESYRGRA